MLYLPSCVSFGLEGSDSSRQYYVICHIQLDVLNKAS